MNRNEERYADEEGDAIQDGRLIGAVAQYQVADLDASARPVYRRLLPLYRQWRLLRENETQ
jgi:hypothetical protein